MDVRSDRDVLSRGLGLSSVWRWGAGAILLSVIAVAGACGDDDGGGSSLTSYEETQLGEVMEADHSEFDVEWEDDVIIAEEEAVFSDLEDLQPYDGRFQVDAGSELLDGVQEGSVVVWPQVGFFEVTEMEDHGDSVEVATEWARFSDVFESAEIHFEHGLHGEEPGRGYGFAREASEESTQQGIRQHELSLEAGPFTLSEEGVSLSGGENVESELSVTGDGAELEFSSDSGGTNVSLSSQVSGLDAEGMVFLDPDAEDPDPEILLQFEDVSVDLESAISVDGESGEVEVEPSTSLVFPFAIGPVPAYIALELRLRVRSSISSGDSLVAARSGFSIDGDVVLARNEDGSFGADADIHSFSPYDSEINFDTAVTAGVGYDVDAPRIAFGLGRPGMASGSIFGTLSGELVGNVEVDPLEEGYCAKLEANAGMFVGGEIELFFWSQSDRAQVANRNEKIVEEGVLCG